MKHLLKYALVLFVALAFIGCDSDDPDPGTAPTPVADDAEVVAGQSVTLNVLDNDTDPEGDAIVLTDVEDPTDGTVTFTEGGEVTISPSYGFAGADQITYTVEDTEGNTATGTINLSVTDALVDVWVSEGDDIAQGLIDFFGATRIVGTFRADNSYEVVTETPNGPFTLTGTFETDATAAGDIRTIGLDQDGGVRAEGIYAVTDDGMTYEVIDVNQGTPPTPEAGFGSTQVGGPTNGYWTQVFVRSDG